VKAGDTAYALARYLVAVSTKFGWPSVAIGVLLWITTWWGFYVRTLGIGHR
jgi:hypothetical protein